MITSKADGLGKVIKQRRLMVELTLRKLSQESGVSQSYLARLERGQRFPSASILRKIAKPLRFSEDELFTLAGYLSPQFAGRSESLIPDRSIEGLDPYVAMVLASEPVNVQRAVMGILHIIREIAQVNRKEQERETQVAS